MRISGFSFARNAVKYYYPVVQSIRSILPLVDEFIIAVGKGDGDDTTREAVASIGDPRIRILDTVWEKVEDLKGRVHSEQTNIALRECTGEWCVYLQADEVVHEEDLPRIKARCEQLLEDRRVEGFLFDYLHFWGDYEHYQPGHGWYRNEIRIIRNGLGIRSWNTAQSFRLPDERKLCVARANARIFHYGWVRPPRSMHRKIVAFTATHQGRTPAEAAGGVAGAVFDFGPLGRLPVYKGTHPAVMDTCIAGMDWRDGLRLVDPPVVRRGFHKDERFKYRILSAIERGTGLDLNHKSYRRVLKG